MEDTAGACGTPTASNRFNKLYLKSLSINDIIADNKYIIAIMKFKSSIIITSFLLEVNYIISYLIKKSIKKSKNIMFFIITSKAS
ncbi:hypothetical protein [Brachyspira innocens]|uniref:hypothetical protein n=1 Tax=Brachyspira innocens TaxID=13264 RepID=UPI0026EFD7DC|nr:hypothetical protein [Brachyspira innocens]